MTATAKFPVALMAAADYGGQVINRQSLTQSGTIDTVVTTVVATTAIPASWPNVGRVVMDSEVIWYGGKSGSTLTGCTRGAEGTAAATHTGAAIKMVLTADQLNQLAVDLIAVQTKVGIDTSAVAASHDFKLSEVTTGASDKAVGKAATQTLTNKTLTSPIENTPTWGTSATISSATFKVVAGATSFAFRNNADTFDNLLIANNGDITVRGIITGVTTLTATTLAGTLSTAAQANVTSLGILTALSISGNLTFTNATARVIPGATSLDFRDTANAQSNLLIANNGDITVRAQIIGVTTLTATTLSGTLNTAAQTAITSVGTLTALSIGGNLTFTGASRRIIAGTTDWALRDNANANSNILVTDAGAVTFRSTVGGITTLTATTLAGTLSTAAQTAITSVGTLSGLTVTGATTLNLGSDADGDVYYRSGGTLTRLAKGTAGQVLRMNSGATAPSWTVDTLVEVFTATGTWTRAAGAKWVEVIVIGAGGGGQGGGAAGVNQVRVGGSGGGGGAYRRVALDAGSLNATETVTVGAAGVSGAGGASAGLGGSAGGIGGNSSFGTAPYLTAYGGGGGHNDGAGSLYGGGGGGWAGAGLGADGTQGIGGAPQVQSSSFNNSGGGGAGGGANAGASQGSAEFGGAGGAGASTTGNSGAANGKGGSSLYGGGAGGCGGGVTSGNVETAAGEGGATNSYVTGGGGAAGAVNGGAGTAGTSRSGTGRAGDGSGGGGGQDSGTGGVGANGGLPGGAAGGGGGGTTVGGAGGAGGRGEVIVITYF